MADYLTRDEMLAIVKCSKSQIYNLMEFDDFPRPIKVGSSNRWIRAEVEAWFDAKIMKRGSKTPVLN